MRNISFFLVAYFLLGINMSFAQAVPFIGDFVNLSKDAEKNGTLDQISDFALRVQVPFIMPDGIKLNTDIYLPILQDSLAFDVTIPVFNYNLKLTVLRPGYQYLIYDSINGEPNPNPFQLPLVMSRTPYNKGGSADFYGALPLLGYAAAMQDMRGRYASEGVYLPLYSDSWKKSDYHQYKHILDLTDLSDPKNGNYHEDGWNTWEFVKNSLMRTYDFNYDGIPDDTALLYNGVMGNFGASALGYNQLQAAAAHRIDPTQPGVKCLFPIVGPLEFYKSTGFQNGVFRDMLVTGWLRGQIRDTDDDLIPIDNDIQNTLHSSNDYGTADKFEASDKAIDHFVAVKYEGSPAGYYPNSIGRGDMDASRAPVDQFGESDKNGTYSRYENMEVPTMHVSGWYDIFVDGSIETWNLQRKHQSALFGNKLLNKIIVGPWAHQTISSLTTGDMTYKSNVTDLTKIDISSIDGENIDVAAIAKSELISWFRYNLNYNNSTANVGEPKVRIPENNIWQYVIPGVSVRFPAETYTMKFLELLNFLTGAGGLNQLPLEIKTGLGKFKIKLDLPALGEPIIEGFDSEPIDALGNTEFKEVDPIRFYVIGPVNDGIAENENMGNYWFGADTFPIKDNIHFESLFLHKNGTLDANPPTTDEGLAIYVHDPDDPIHTIGGGNMLVKTPQGDRDNQGQMNCASPLFAPFTMNRPGVLKFETAVVEDSLCMIGFPKFKIYAKSNPGTEISGPTDTDFNVRILDVYPDGRELFVQEGCVNAKAREWAAKFADGVEDDNADYSNIEIGKLYEYYFQGLPIAYTFGKGHKIKILVSSSNYPRYQSNPNIPIEEGEFFRRKPSDGLTYTFQGREYAPRIAVQRIAFSPESPSQIILPVYGESKIVGVKNNVLANNQIDIDVFPNPSSDKVNIFVGISGQFDIRVFDAIGKLISMDVFSESIQLDIKNYPMGQYFIEIQDKSNPAIKTSRSFTKI
ncbi:MAG: CocE/NonD family hydrolase [Bacteroidetes bacterium]|jgi:predicted acyl esterase|nr:CocE/NonD family hydrolase [Bacteroidota bacterium]MBP7257033.1 CocE/NonD family hydrolase [Chitinophagales bacterium]MBK7505154.1 CocE/NonD family hydrolase [Bacteroidota bacterium]MBK7641422.1 CocE/NonD family hydrolase [Bacteroidota bacterium]MBK8673434.1 CocE/NonD family hydrolase [Bacteroidota bacterium]